MKYFVPLCFTFLLLAGCEKPVSPKTDSPSYPVSVETEKIDTSALGEVCGGADELRCETGLECEFDGTRSRGEGLCVKSVIDESLECPDTKAPVCGQKGRVKNGYLNECQARRHGATIVSEGFCKNDETVKGNCKGRLQAIGNCDTVFTGFEAADGKCREVSISACDAEVPFATEGECKISCK